MLKLSFLYLLLSFNSYASEQIIEKYKKLYQSLNLSSYQMSFEKNIESSLKLVEDDSIREKFKMLVNLSKACLTGLKCTIIHHETERTSLRLKFGYALKLNDIKTLKQLKKNKEIYELAYRLAYFEWTNDLIIYADLESYEIEQIKKIRKKMSSLKIEKNNEVRSISKVLKYLTKINTQVNRNVKKIFSKRTVPKIKFKLNSNPKSQHIPGYYDFSTGTFYFTMPGGKVNLGDLDWLFLHEAVPGHHFQMMLNKDSFATELLGRNLVYLDFIEGWAAYVETFGEDLGIYKTSAAKKKAYEWDLLRSVRVILDIGIHQYGWSKKKAKAKWKSLAPEVINLADREIDRIMKWPAQVISYEYGKMNIMKAKEKYLKNNNNLLSFHDEMLKRGQIPTSILKDL